MIKIMAVAKGANAFIITIDKKVIRYWDAFEGKLWGTFLQWLPPTKDNAKKIMMSRNKIPAHFIDFLKVPDDELKEYDNAADDEELFKIVERDLIKNQCKIIETVRMQE